MVPTVKVESPPVKAPDTISSPQDTWVDVEDTAACDFGIIKAKLVDVELKTSQGLLRRILLRVIVH